MKTPLEAPPEQVKAETGVKEPGSKEAASVIDTSKMSKGQREALELAEASRDPLDERGSFASNLFIGRYDFDRIFPYPAQTANEPVVQWRNKLHGDVEGSDLKATFPRTADEITNRLIFLMVNEAARCLEGNVVATPEDADFGMMMGTGFAPFRGGPLRFADHFGLKKLVEEMDALQGSAGEKFAACDLLREHAQRGTKFYEGAL